MTVRRHHKLVKVHRPGHVKLVNVTKCKPRAIKRKVTIVVRERRHGKTVLVKRRKVERVVVPPRVVNGATKRVRYGQAATVSGWLGTSSGIALAGRNVDVMTSPNDGRGRWNREAVVTTDANGTWTVRLPRGPARLVQAVYAGDSTTEPSTTNTVHLVVPAKVEMNVSPHSTRWGGTIKITGRVLGGYIPAGKLLRLRIGVEGVKETVGIPSITPDGRFQTTWTFAPGRGVVRYWFSVSTLNEADYPYAPASSPRVYVTVGQR